MTELLRPLAWLEPVADLLRLAVFLSLLALGLASLTGRARGASGEATRRRRVGRLLAFALAVSTAVGLTQVESWPFSNWALVHGLAGPRAARVELQGVDSTGTAHAVDLRALQPLPPEEFASWLRAEAPRLGADGHARLGRWLLERAEQARRRVRAGSRAAPNERWLGPLTAPHHFHFPAHLSWRRAEDAPTLPFTGVRVWFVEWDVEERSAGSAGTSRQLALEFSS